MSKDNGVEHQAAMVADGAWSHMSEDQFSRRMSDVANDSYAGEIFLQAPVKKKVMKKLLKKAVKKAIKKTKKAKKAKKAKKKKAKKAKKKKKHTKNPLLRH